MEPSALAVLTTQMSYTDRSALYIRSMGLHSAASSRTHLICFKAYDWLLACAHTPQLKFKVPTKPDWIQNFELSAQN